MCDFDTRLSHLRHIFVQKLLKNNDGNYILGVEVNIMKRIRLPHSVIVKSPGLLPMLYTVHELSDAIGIPERTLRDWLTREELITRSTKGQTWVNGRKFADWVGSMQKPKRDRKLKDQEAYCMRCKEIVEMLNPETNFVRGKLIVIRGKCPNCGCTINRGGRLPSLPKQFNQTQRIPKS